MKKAVLIIILLLSVIVFYSCEEDFNLKTDYKPRYMLNCILRADTSIQLASLTKSYMVDGFDPYVYSEDPFISGADIRIWQKDNVFFFKDTLLERPDTSRFHFPQKAYLLRDFAPAENDFLEIKAILDNGKVLQGVTRIPKKVKWDTSSTFILPVDGSDVFNVRWFKNVNIGWFLLRLQVKYKTAGINSPTISAIIPVKYEGNKPVYPAPTKNAGISFQWSAFDRTMKTLADGINDKSQIIIYGITVELLVFDDNLSKYFSNLNGYMDDFTIRVDQNDFSNIEGGFGIFGSYLKQNSGIKLQQDYIKSLGYGVPN